MSASKLSRHLNPGTSLTTRRAFLATSAGVAGAFALWSFHHPQAVSASGTGVKSPAMVTIIQFGADGKPTGKVTIPRVVKTNAEWKSQLSKISYSVTRNADTEHPFTGDTWNLHDRGLYRCICCDNALFSSDTKFESGTGWPSFYQPITRENITTDSDSSLGEERTAVACKLCEAHLGHVFDDGPQPTGLRYCMNSAAMKFVKFS